jgi:hypothetical protein
MEKKSNFDCSIFRVFFVVSKFCSGEELSEDKSNVEHAQGNY